MTDTAKGGDRQGGGAAGSSPATSRRRLWGFGLLGVAAAAALVAIAVVAHRGGSQWALVDLGPVPGHPGAFLSGPALSDSEVVVGTATDSPVAGSVGFRWSDGRMITLGYPGSHDVFVAGVNDSGLAVGTAQVGKRTVGVVWDSQGRPTSIGSLGGATTSPAAINGRGQVVGASETKDGHPHAFIWENGRIVDLGTLGGESSGATAINSAGQVIGTSDTASGASRAFAWRSGRMTELGTPGGQDTRPLAINDAGTIVGDTEDPNLGPLRAVVWKNGKTTLLPAGDGSEAIAVNRRGEVLVRSEIGAPVLFGPDLHATRIEGPSGHRSLFRPTRVVGLNDLGQVLGYGYVDGQRRVFVWGGGKTELLPSDEGSAPPWGGPAQINNQSQAVGDSYPAGVRGIAGNRIVVWRHAA